MISVFFYLWGSHCIGKLLRNCDMVFTAEHDCLLIFPTPDIQPDSLLVLTVLDKEFSAARYHWVERVVGPRDSGENSNISVRPPTLEACRVLLQVHRLSGKVDSFLKLTFRSK